MRNAFGGLLLAAGIALAAPALAQEFPTKPIRIVVPYAAGGGTDLVARMVAQKLNEKWGQPVIVENRAGAGGNLGAEAVLHRRAGRLHAAVHRAGTARRQQEPLRQAELRSGRVHAGVAGGRRLQHAARQSEAARPTICRR